MQYIQQKIEVLLCNDRFLIAECVSLVCIIYLILRISNCNKIEKSYYIIVILWFLVMLVYLASRGRLPIRIGISLVFGLGAITFGEMYKDLQITNDIYEKFLRIKSKDSFIFSLLVLLCIVIFVNIFELYKDNCDEKELATAKNQIMIYCLQDPDGLYLRDFYSFSQRGNWFYGNINSSNYIVTGGWSYKTPVYKEILEVNGITNTIIDSIKDGKRVYY